MNPSATSIQATTPATAPAVWVLGDRLSFMGSLAAPALDVVRVEVPPGSGTPPHRHASVEIFQVLSGEITFGTFAEGQPPQHFVAGPGAVVTVPSGVGHNYGNAGEGPAVMTVVVEPAMTAFFRSVGTATAPPPGPPAPDVLAAVLAACERHGIEMLGTPPA
jgi:quercetin dioxygenase-like cupin family protein